MSGNTRDGGKEVNRATGGDLLGVGHGPQVHPAVNAIKQCLAITFQHANPERSRDPKGMRALGRQAGR